MTAKNVLRRGLQPITLSKHPHPLTRQPHLPTFPVHPRNHASGQIQVPFLRLNEPPKTVIQRALTQIHPQFLSQFLEFLKKLGFAALDPPNRIVILLTQSHALVLS
jgi:hypothetical protein